MMTKRTMATVLTAALVFSAFVAPAAEAKKKKKKPPVAACAAYAPGELGAEAETVVVTDAATAEAPATHAFAIDANFTEGLETLAGMETPTQYVNVQVDSAAAAAGLYVTWEFSARRDYDLYARHQDGSEAASSHGFSPAIETQGTQADVSNTETNHAGETKADSENIVGLTTADCGGYTFQLKNYFGEGGDHELKIWLGEGTTDPRPVGETP